MANMRDECIALQAVQATITSLTLHKKRTFKELADEAISSVEEAARKGELGIMYASWTTDPEEARSGITTN